MKRTLKYIGLAFAASLAFAACDRNLEPEFNDKDAFVAFDKVSMTIPESYSEDGETVKVAVTLASVAGLEETVKFSITEPETKAAKEGVNYELVTTSGVLSFNAENRTQYIEFKTKTDGEYTGDLSFSIEILGNDNIAAGSENVCTVKITDIDHPLAFMLGDYTMTGPKYTASGPVQTSWTMTIIKDEEDETKVWFYNLFGNDGWAGDDILYYGNVTINEGTDTHVLNIPFGQDSEYLYGGTTPVKLLGLSSDLNGYDSGSVDVAIKEIGDKVTLDFGQEWGFWFYIEGAGSIGTYLPGISAVKN